MQRCARKLFTPADLASPPAALSQALFKFNVETCCEEDDALTELDVDARFARDELPRSMFRSKRSGLVKRLWKLRFGSRHEAASEAESGDDDMELKSAGQSLLKRLKEHELEALVSAVETRGAETTPCLLLSRSVLVQLGKRKVEPHLVCCQLWRWHDMDSVDDNVAMKHLPSCRHPDAASDGRSGSVCCNPYHWSRVVAPGIPQCTRCPY